MIEEQEFVTIVDRRESNPYRKPFLVLIGVICVSLLSQAFGTWLVFNVAHNTNLVTKNTNALVKDVTFRNSPENARNQKKNLDEVILRVDCNSRKAIEEALNQITKDNPSIRGTVNITTVLCTNALNTENSSPTTTP